MTARRPQQPPFLAEMTHVFQETTADAVEWDGWRVEVQRIESLEGSHGYSESDAGWGEPAVWVRMLHRAVLVASHLELQSDDIDLALHNARLRAVAWCDDWRPDDAHNAPRLAERAESGRAV